MRVSSDAPHADVIPGRWEVAPDAPAPAAVVLRHHPPPGQEVRRRRLGGWSGRDAVAWRLRPRLLARLDRGYARLWVTRPAAGHVARHRAEVVRRSPTTAVSSGQMRSATWSCRDGPSGPDGTALSGEPVRGRRPAPAAHREGSAGPAGPVALAHRRGTACARRPVLGRPPGRHARRRGPVAQDRGRPGRRVDGHRPSTTPAELGGGPGDGAASACGPTARWGPTSPRGSKGDPAARARPPAPVAVDDLPDTPVRDLVAMNLWCDRPGSPRPDRAPARAQGAKGLPAPGVMSSSRQAVHHSRRRSAHAAMRSSAPVAPALRRAVWASRSATQKVQTSTSVITTS